VPSGPATFMVSAPLWSGILQTLETRRLILFSGKGGVGKTTCSAAAALHLARGGKRTLLVTIDPAKRLADALGVAVGAHETSIAPRLHAMMLDPAAVLREHLERQIPEAKVTEHPLFRYASSALPGLNELMAIGKLNDLRREEKYDCIVVDTPPTGHALSFLSTPQAIEELMSEASILRWAMRGYSVWRKLYGTARNVRGLLGKTRKPAPADIDFERLFASIRAEAERVRTFLTDERHAALVLVTLPEKLPVEETVEFEAAARERLGMKVQAIVVNKVQPDPLASHAGRLEAITKTPATRRAFAQKAAQATGNEPATIDALVAAAEFSRVRREMNLAAVADLRRRLPKTPLVLVPLFRNDVHGVASLKALEGELFDPRNTVA
jgi:TRC40/GET3/ArsA family transport-energizing ATPase